MIEKFICKKCSHEYPVDELVVMDGENFCELCADHVMDMKSDEYRGLVQLFALTPIDID